ncbi:MAG: hypothetical protein A2Y91_01325 [Chloroflexi bacterium RBG_13_54_8]|nr:MAG: hypothetical protein A2Y91_01325 [Chloroflexi bacterium RBG_13_54_8]
MLSESSETGDVTVDAFSPISIRGMELANRFVRSATHDTSTDGSGAVTEKSVSIYKALGEGGTGLIVSGYAYCWQESRRRHQ